MAEPARMTAPADRRVLPHNLEAEEAVVGAVLFSGRTLNDVSDLLEPGDFYHPALQAIYEAMLELAAQAQPIDLITVAAQMKTAETLGKIRSQGGEAYLAELSSKVATVENIAHHARIVREKSQARRLILAASGIVDAGFADKLPVARYAEEAQDAIFSATAAAVRSDIVPLRTALHEEARLLERRYTQKRAITGCATGFSKLDELTSGLQPSELIIIAGRPSMGKTSLVMQAGLNAAAPPKDVLPEPVLVFSLEMSRQALVERMLSCDARVDSQRLRTGYLEMRDWQNLTRSMSRMAEAPLWLDDQSTSLAEIRARARRWRSMKGVFTDDRQTGLIVIDYLQLIQARGGKDTSREQEISGISRGLKALAKQLRVPVVALSQLSRACEQRADKRPMASDLRESGAIEQDADLIAFIYRDEVYNPETTDRGIAEVNIAKQRTGPTGTVRLAFLNHYTRFENLAYQPPPPGAPAHWNE